MTGEESTETAQGLAVAPLEVRAFDRQTGDVYLFVVKGNLMHRLGVEFEDVGIVTQCVD